MFLHCEQRFSPTEKQRTKNYEFTIMMYIDLDPDNGKNRRCRIHK